MPFMRIMADNDVIGVVEAIRHILDSENWTPFAQYLEIEFVNFDDLGLKADAQDHTIWKICQSENVLLVTGNRAGGPDSLDAAIHDLGGVESLPVITIAN